MTVSAINGVAFSTLSAISGRTLSTLSHINGQEIVSSGPSEVPYTTGLVLALEADHIEGLNDGDPVTLWTDYSPLVDSPTATGSDGPQWETNQLNSLPGCDFLPSDPNAMNLAANVDCNPVSIFAVLSRDAGDGPYTVISGDTGAGQFRIFQGKPNFLKRATADMGSATTALTVGQFYVIGFTYDGTNGAFYKDGAADGTFSSVQTLNDFNGLGKGGVLGGEFYSGVICALLVYDHVLDSGDRDTVTNYLGNKYGITV